MKAGLLIEEINFAERNFLLFETPYSGGRNLYCNYAFKKLIHEAS